MSEMPDFTEWTLDRLVSQRDHLGSLLTAAAGQNDPLRPRLRAERDAVCAMIEHRCAHTRQCARCGHVLVDEDEQGWYYQVPKEMEFPPGMDFPAGTVLTFMDRVHECDGKPHEVVARTAA